MCREKDELRRKIQKRKSKFDEIVLPIEPEGSGYHVICYRCFVAIHDKNVGSGESQTMIKLVLILKIVKICCNFVCLQQLPVHWEVTC